ncbi:allophanate hydrolase 2 subunit 2 [Gracilibacillus boraciitolerans JCM 21714]|uniref:Allophanate hydrolase 2 subunit 2 n=1 Tax=Gracilibacillus boraciitolerans JCM 21714 TaxID=1298598 RepID=W4VFW7_9BACI|nr:hypothetical protein [Gracilibacillus boraciitolerans]GAE92046.1 allophanate hydrolase 2 subunit 2 [Gracilibacillus boraciitolerans JCM 21714]
MTLEIIEEGLHTTIQDKGRIGYQSYGFSVSGAMDEYAATMANLVVGNHKDAAGIEMSFIGPTVSFDQDTIIAITGADMTANISEQVIPLGKAIQINKGDILQFRTAKSGLYGYLAVKGGLDLPEILGSSSTVARAGIKGILGRKLTIGDQLPICQSHSIKQSINWRLLLHFLIISTKTL